MTTHKARWLLVGLVCLALWPVHAPAQGGPWESYTTAGQQAYQQADYAEAEKQFNADIPVAKWEAIAQAIRTEANAKSIVALEARS